MAKNKEALVRRLFYKDILLMKHGENFMKLKPTDSFTRFRLVLVLDKFRLAIFLIYVRQLD